MKKLILLISIALVSTSMWSQIKHDDDLEKKLKGKTSFQDIKQISLDHYQELSKTVNPSDKGQNKYVNKQLKHLNRRFWIDEFYVNEDGTPGNRGKIDYEAVTNLKKQEKNLKRTQPNPWTLEGPFNITTSSLGVVDGIGRFDHIAFHPTNVNIMWAGSPLGGLFKTVNGGASWFPLTSYLPSLGVAGIAINFNNPNIIYIMSGSSNDGPIFFSNTNYGQGNNGVFKSTDGGITWSQSGLNGKTGRDILIHPTNPDIIIAATGSGVYRSTNAGATWILSNLLGDVRDIEFKPGNPNIVYAVRINRFFKSIDGGSSFTQKTNSQLNAGPNGRIVIGTTLDNPNRVYLFSGPNIDDDNDDEPDRFKGFFSSNNSGESFIRLTQTPVLFSSTQGVDVPNDQSGYDIAIAVNPLNENEIFVGGIVVWRSTNGGFTWNQVSAYWDYAFQANYMHPDIHDLQYNPLNNQLFCANDGGIYRREESSFDWIPFYNGLSAATFYQFEIEDDNGKLWGGAQDNGIMVQSSGLTFFNYNGGDGFDLMTDHSYDVNNGESNDIFYTVNQRICVDKIFNNCTRSVDGNAEFFGKLAMSPVDEDDIYVGYSHGLFFSDDAGDDWTEVGFGPANWCISSCRNRDQLIYFAGNNGSGSGQRLSRWDGAFGLPGIESNLTNNLISAGYNSNLKITDIDVSRTDFTDFYVSVAGTDSSSKVFFTNNGGNSFNNLTHDLPNVPIFCIKTDETNGIYAGTSIGIYYLPFGSSNWQPFYNGLPNVAVTEIELASSDPNNLGVPPFTKVYASTFGRGIWSADSFDSCVSFLAKTGNVQGAQFYEAGTQLTSTQVLSGGEYTELKLNSGNRIRLLPGFHAPSGHYMKTFLEGCGGDVLGN